MESFNKYSLLEHLPVATNIVDVSGKYLYVSNRFVSLVGYSREELLGMTFYDLTPPNHRHADRTALDSLANFGVTGWFNKSYFRKDGLLVSVDLKINKLTLSNRIFYLAIIDLA